MYINISAMKWLKSFYYNMGLFIESAMKLKLFQHFHGNYRQITGCWAILEFGLSCTIPSIFHLKKARVPEVGGASSQGIIGAQTHSVENRRNADGKWRRTSWCCNKISSMHSEIDEDVTRAPTLILLFSTLSMEYCD